MHHRWERKFSDNERAILRKSPGEDVEVEVLEMIGPETRGPYVNGAAHTYHAVYLVREVESGEVYPTSEPYLGRVPVRRKA